MFTLIITNYSYRDICRDLKSILGSNVTGTLLVLSEHFVLIILEH